MSQVYKTGTKNGMEWPNAIKSEMEEGWVNSFLSAGGNLACL